MIYFYWTLNKTRIKAYFFGIRKSFEKFMRQSSDVFRTILTARPKHRKRNMTNDIRCAFRIRTVCPYSNTIKTDYRQPKTILKRSVYMLIVLIKPFR